MKNNLGGYMEKFDIVKLKEKNIFGINYPLVHIHLYFKEKCNYRLEIDNNSEGLPLGSKGISNV